MKSMLKVAVIGAGMFGGTVVKTGADLGLPGIVLNASKKDIEVFDNIEGISSFVVGDGNGTGKNRDVAKEFLLNSISVVEEEKISETIINNDIIVVAGAAGGGFGSGTVPSLITILTQLYPEKLIMALTSLPDIDESYTAQKHAEDFMRELLELNIPYLVYDNNKFKALSADKIHSLVMENIKTDLQIISGMYVTENVDGSNIDERDLLTTLSTPGRIIPTLLFPYKESDASIAVMIKDKIDKSAHSEMENDKVVAAMATMYNLTEEVVADKVASLKADLRATFGEPISDYRNEAIYNGVGDQFVSVILTGLTAPNTRIDEIISKRVKIENIEKSRKASGNKLNSVEHGSLSIGAKAFGGSTSKKERPSVAELAAMLKK